MSRHPTDSPPFDREVVKAVRGQLSRAKFSRLLGVGLPTIKNWEAGRCSPQGPASLLLRLLHRNPDMMILVEILSKKAEAHKCESCGSDRAAAASA